MATIIRNCPHCPAEHSAFQITWCARVPHLPPNRWIAAAMCGSCSMPICFEAIGTAQAASNPPNSMNANIEPIYFVLQVWPERRATTAPPYTPSAVAARFLEGEDAFQRHKWNSAVAMYRSALDIATKGMEGVPAGETFFRRLEWLHQKHAITPDIRSWADHVRVEGNAALHDPEEFDEADARALRFFTEMFLRYVFELPGAVREFRGEPQTKTPPVQD